LPAYSFSGASEAQTVQRIDIIEYGIFTLSKESRDKEPGTILGYGNITSNEKLVQATTTSPARPGVRFGLRFKIVGTPNAVVKIKTLTRFPPPGINNPNTGKAFMESVVSRDGKVGTTRYTGYGFDHDWEMVPGTWTIELWDGDRKLASQSFNVVKE
jgi:hypothetical protein